MPCFRSATVVLAFGVLFASGMFRPALAQTAGKCDGRHQRREPRVRSNRRVLRGQASKFRQRTSSSEGGPSLTKWSRAAYEFFIERPISENLTQHATQDRIHYIVVTKGIPLRVRGSSGLEGSVASVDSELTLLYRKLLGIPIPPAGRIPNPYYLGDRALSGAQRFAHRTHDIFLVTRLDGFSVDDVIKLIDRGAAPARDGIFVLDQRAVVLGNRVGDDWLNSAAERLAGGGFGERVLLERSKVPATTTAPALGYYSWGSNDASVSTRSIDVVFAPGALAGMFVSTDARTFKEPPAGWNIGKWGQSKGYFEGSPQSLAGDLIRAGVTGVSGHVAEPYLDGSARPQILFPGLRRRLQPCRIVLSFHSLSVLAERGHRRPVMRAVHEKRKSRSRTLLRRPTLTQSCRSSSQIGGWRCSSRTTFAGRSPG